MLFDDLKKKKIEYMKAKMTDETNALSMIISKCMLVMIDKRKEGKELTDADVISVFMKSEKELLDERAGYEKLNRTESIAEIDKQLSVVRAYIPKMMSDDEIREVIAGLEDKSIGSVMKHFKNNYAGKCDMRNVQAVLKNL